MHNIAYRTGSQCWLPRWGQFNKQYSVYNHNRPHYWKKIAVLYVFKIIFDYWMVVRNSHEHCCYNKGTKSVTKSDCLVRALREVTRAIFIIVHGSLPLYLLPAWHFNKNWSCECRWRQQLLLEDYLMYIFKLFILVPSSELFSSIPMFFFKFLVYLSMAVLFTLLMCKSVCYCFNQMLVCT